VTHWAAAQQHVPPETLAAVPSDVLDKLAPAARQAYERRDSVAAALRDRLGLPLNSPVAQQIATEARATLRHIDQIGAEPAA
jgi:hypothetical protein